MSLERLEQLMERVSAAAPDPESNGDALQRLGIDPKDFSEMAWAYYLDLLEEDGDEMRAVLDVALTHFELGVQFGNEQQVGTA